MNLTTTLFLILIASLIGYESDRVKPKPYPLGSGDTLMVRIQGYEFCPRNCDADHFHTGHFKNYDCEENICTHITINDEEWFRKAYNVCMDVHYSLFHVLYVGRPKIYDWACTCLHFNDNGAY